MTIKSEDIPQADNLIDVIECVMAVSDGARTYQEIASKIGKVERQGRYYRKAAELLGFLINERNDSHLTEIGQDFSQNPTVENPILLQAIFNARIFQRIIPFFEIKSQGVTKEELIEYLTQITETVGDSMLPRRASTILSWLKLLNVVVEENNIFQLNRNLNQILPVLEFTDLDEPILPHSIDLVEYQIVEQRVSSAKESITFTRDQVQYERANDAHRNLINITASKINQKGIQPKFNPIIDLAAKFENNDYIFEMKSITDSNARSQIRKGISQLYEYSYVQNLPNAKLVLVIEKNLPSNVSWMHDYLESDRNIMLVWDGNDDLFSSEDTRRNLSLLFSN